MKEEITLTTCAILLEEKYNERKIQKATKVFFSNHEHIPSIIEEKYFLLLPTIWSSRKGQYGKYTAAYLIMDNIMCR